MDRCKDAYTFAERNWYKMVGKCVQIVSLYLNSHKFHHHHSLLRSYIDMGWFLGSSDLLIFLSSHTNMFCIESENLIYVVIPKVFIKTKIWHPKIKATRILRDVVIWRKSISNPSMISPNLMKLTFSQLCVQVCR